LLQVQSFATLLVIPDGRSTMANDLGSTLARLRESLAKAGRAVATSRPVSAARRRPGPVIAVVAVAAAAAAGGAWIALEGRPDWGPLAPTSLAELTQHVRENPRDAAARRDLGHAQYAAGRRRDALVSYGRALAIDTGAADDRLVENAVASFGRHEQDKAEALIVRYQLGAAAKDLEPLTRNPRYSVRWGALRTLQKLGKDSREAWLNAYVADLSSPDCDVRRRAVEELGDMGDRSALSAVRRAKAADEKTGGWFRATCLGDRDEQAEKAILARRWGGGGGGGGGGGPPRAPPRYIVPPLTSRSLRTPTTPQRSPQAAQTSYVISFTTRTSG